MALLDVYILNVLVIRGSTGKGEWLFKFKIVPKGGPKEPVKMNVMRWKVRKLITVLLGIILLMIFLRPRQFTFNADIKIPKIQPSEVWEYVADFSNMIKLNPTIIDFSIIAESGNYEHWQYTTRYTEHLSHWPYLKNVGIGHFSVHSNWRKQHYFINSTHNTCFFPGLLCLNSESEFRFIHLNYTDVKPIKIGTLCEEIVRYECPLVFYYFCRREVAYQRDAIMNNLSEHFKK